MKYRIIFTRILLTVLSISLIYSLNSFSQEKKENGISFKAADKSNVSIFIVLKELPDQFFLFTIPEIFTGKSLNNGLFNADLIPWKLNGNTATRTVENTNYSYDIRLNLNHKESEYWMEWTIKFKNNSKLSLYDLAAFNCLTMNFAPLFKDTTMSRTFAKDQFGKPIMLKNILKTSGNGRRNMQFYPVMGGIDLEESPWINNWNVISKTILSGNRIWLNSIDGKWKIETIVDGQPAFFFNNWEHDHGCIHSSPLLTKELKPSQTAIASGKFRFIKLKD
jgi:hypothetical protein